MIRAKKSYKAGLFHQLRDLLPARPVQPVLAFDHHSNFKHLILLSINPAGQTIPRFHRDALFASIYGSDIKHPIIGFYGEINDWLDLNMLAEAARLKPEWSFVLLGRIAVEVGNIRFLTDLPNVLHLGQKKFEQLPAYCAAFDVALIPMKINELTLSVNPLKLREYLAAGVPVVSTPLPEVLAYKDVVKFGTTADELVKATEECLRQDRKELAPMLSQRVASESWDVKVEEITKIIEEALIFKKQSLNGARQNNSP